MLRRSRDTQLTLSHRLHIQAMVLTAVSSSVSRDELNPFERSAMSLFSQESAYFATFRLSQAFNPIQRQAVRAVHRGLVRKNVKSSIRSWKGQSGSFGVPPQTAEALHQATSRAVAVAVTTSGLQLILPLGISLHRPSPGAFATFRGCWSSVRLHLIRAVSVRHDLSMAARRVILERFLDRV